jgi:hypothetical protein
LGRFPDTRKWPFIVAECSTQEFETGLEYGSLPMGDVAATADGRAALLTFVRTNFGLRGTLHLHRFAFGADLLRAPVNVVLAPVFILTRLAALLAMRLRFHKSADWLSRRKLLFETSVSRQVSARVTAFILHLDAMGPGVIVPHDTVKRAVADYTGVRQAVGEITTTILVLVTGYMLFESTTPGVISLVGPIAEMHAQSLAVQQFPLGEGLGGLYYGIFPADLGIGLLLVTGAVLATLASVVTTFAGVIADPIQVLTGTHRRRLLSLISRLEVNQRPNSGLATEHITARLADVTDMVLNLWRILRG